MRTLGGGYGGAIAVLMLMNPEVRAQLGPPRYFDGLTFQSRGMDLSDLDADGDQDIVICGNSHNVTTGVWCFENPGTGSFSAPTTLLATGQGFTIKSMFAADLDDDGDEDLLLASNRTMWMENQGGLLFSDTLFIFEDYDLEWISPTDVDNDGDLDVAFTSTAPFPNRDLEWVENLGNGAFGDTHFIAVLPNEAFLVSGNINGDGMLDFAATIANIDSTCWFAGVGQGAFGTAQPVMPSVTDTYACGALIDIEMDGDLDMVAGSYDQMNIAVNDGTGNFTPTAPSGAMTYPDVIVPADIDSDGLMDLLVGSGVQIGIAPQVMYNTGSAFEAMSSALMPSQLGLATCLGIEGADMNGDGRMDVVSVLNNGLFLSLQNADSTFSRPLPIDYSHGGEAQLADVDGDGDQDVLFHHGGRVVWYERDSADHIGPARLFRGEQGSGKSLALDVDGDGDQDVVHGDQRVWINNGEGWALSNSPFGSGGEGFGAFKVLGSADLDLDGDVDVFGGQDYMNYSRYGWYENPGTGPPFIRHALADDCPLPLDAAMADLDMDGLCDVVLLSNLVNGGLQWLENSGAGEFVAHAIGTGHASGKIRAGDLDGDGDPDVVHNSPDGLHWFRNNGTGTFGAAIELLPGTSVVTDMDFLDLDNDQEMDLLFLRTGGGPLEWLRNMGGAFSFELSTVADLDPDIGELATGDVDNDGDIDLLFGGSGRSGYFDNPLDPPYLMQGMTFADMDGNGLRDEGEPALPSAHIIQTPPGSFALSDLNGHYQLHTDMSPIGVTAHCLWPWWHLSSSPDTFQVEFVPPDSAFSDMDFGFTPEQEVIALHGDYVEGNSVCGSPLEQHAFFSNLGDTLYDVLVDLERDAQFSWSSFEPAPDSVAGTHAYWSLDTLPTLGGGYFTVFLETPSADQMGSAIDHRLTVSGTNGADPADVVLVDSLVSIYACAFDPNDKHVSPVGYGTVGAVPVGTDEFVYTIRFQNTGTATAQRVIVFDILDPDLDPQTLEILGSSHPITEMGVSADGELRVEWDNIMLPDSGADALASQGFLTYAIRPMASSGHGTIITNSADIVFDNNAPVLTNTTTNTLVDCSLFGMHLDLFGWSFLIASSAESHQWLLDGVEIPGATAQTLVPEQNGYYTVRGMSDYGCTATSEAVQLLSTAVSATGNVEVGVAPVPFSETTTVRLSQPVGDGSRMSVSDMAGRVVRTTVLPAGDRFELKRGDLRQGMYLVSIIDSDGSIMTARVVVD